MKKYLLSILFFCLGIAVSYAQTFCTPSYIDGCSAMYIDGVQLDSVNQYYSTEKSYVLNSGTGCNVGNIKGYSAKNKGTVKLFAGSIYKFVITTQLDSLGAIGFALDFNSDGVFDSNTEIIQSNNYSSNGSPETSVYFAVPATVKEGQTKLRIITIHKGLNKSIVDACMQGTVANGEIEDYDVTFVVPPKSVKNITINPQSVNYVYQKSLDNKVLIFDIETEGITGNLELNKLTFEILNNDSIDKRYLYFWENNNWVNIQNTPTKTNTGLTINFKTPRLLNNKNNLFALFYDLDIPPARLGNARVGLDTKLTDVVINNVSQANLITKQTNLIQLVPQIPSFNSNFCNGKSLVQIFQMAQMADSYNLRASNCNATISSSYSPTASHGTTINSVLKVYKSGYNAGLYIDWDGDLQFNSANEFINLGVSDSNKVNSFFVNIPKQLADSNIFVRLLISQKNIDKNSATLDFTNIFSQGESRDYFLRIKPASQPDNLLGKIKYYQFDSLLVVKGDTSIKALTVVIDGDKASAINLSTQSFKFNTGATPNGNISKAKLWAGSSLNDISLAKQIGTTVLDPNGTFTFNTTVKIASGKNYFFVTYDISYSATFNTVVEAKLDNITFDNNTTKTASLDSIFTFGQIKVVEYIRITNGISSTGCNILFTDNGGKDGAFTSSQLPIKHEFSADNPNNTLKLKFITFDLGMAGVDNRPTDDTLYIYDGLGANAILIKALTNIEYWSMLSGNYQVVSKQGAFTFKFASQGNITKQGWTALLTCEYNCSKNPLTTSFTVDSIKCAGELAKVHFKVIKSNTPSYKVSYTDWNGFKKVKLTFNSDTFTVKLPTSSQGPNLTITNENGCTLSPQLNLPNKNLTFSLYPDEYSRNPTCQIANNGMLSYYQNVSDTNAVISAVWSSEKTGKVVGTFKGVKKQNGIRINNLMYDSTYNVIFTNSLGGCLAKTEIIKSGRNTYYDSTGLVYSPSKPTTMDTVFVVGDKIQSSVGVELHLPNGNIPNPDMYLVDSAKWIFEPLKLKNIVNILSDTLLVSNFDWDSTFSGILSIKAQVYQAGCKGPISAPLKIKIIPSLKINTDTVINNNPKDSATFPVVLKGTKPFKITVFNPKTQVIIQYENIVDFNYNLKIPNGNYEIVSISDSFNLSNTLNKPVVVILDTVKLVNYKIVSNPVCAGKKGKVKFSSVGGKLPIVYKVFDSNGNEILSGDSVSLVAGNYILKAIDVSGFVSKPIAFSIANPQSNQISVPTIVSPQSPYITNVDSNIVNVKANVSPFNSFKKIVWSVTPSNALLKSDTTLSSKLYLDKLTSGVFKVRAITVDTAGCISDSSNTITINRNAKANLVFTDSTFYLGDSVNFAVNYTGTFPAKIKYQVGSSGIISKIINSQISYFAVKNSGKFNVLYFKDKDSINVIYTNPKVNFNVDSISAVTLKVDSITCANQSGYAQVKITGGKPDHTFTVYDLNDKIISTITGIDPSVALQLGNYKATVKDANGFHYKDTLYFDIKTGLNPYRKLKPIFTSKPADSIPAGSNPSNFILDLPGYNSLPTYNWYYLNYSASISDTYERENENTIDWYKRFTGTSEIKVVAKIGGCKTDTAYFKIKIKPSVKILQLTNGNVLVKFNGTSPFRINYNFDNNPTKDSTVTLDSLLIPYNGGSKIYVTLVGDANYNTGFGGDLTLKTKNATVGFRIYEAFSPNNDNVNETFVIDSLPSGTANFQVIDRNGFIVYNNANYKNDWNGKDNSGEPVTDGVYYFVITINNSTKSRYSGPIEIRR